MYFAAGMVAILKTILCYQMSLEMFGESLACVTGWQVDEERE